MRDEALLVTADGDLRDRLRERLGASNVAVSAAFARGVTGERDAARPFEVSVHREGTLAGGLVASVRRGWLDVDILWVDAAFRGGGLGGRLLAAAEREGARLGARRAKLTTFDFQAPGFYAARGYSVYGTLDDYPEGCTLFLMRKDLA